MLEKYCDILVIGNELPGLVTAAFLARRGLTVQVIDFDLYADHPKTPDPVCLTNIHSKLLRSILGRLNVPEVTIQNFIKQDASLQVIFPEHRVDVLNNPLTYFEEIEREFPEHYLEIKAFYENQARLRHKTDINELFQQLLPNSWKEKRLFKKFIQEQLLNEKSADYRALMKKDACLNYYLKTQFLLAYQNIIDDPFAYQVSELFNPGDGEIFGVHAGIGDLKKMLCERIRQYDGVTRNKVQINSLLFRNGVFEGVELDDNQNTVLSKYIIWNAGLGKLAKLLPNKWRFRGLRKKSQNFSPEFHWFSIKYHIDKNFIPEPMKSNVVLISDFNKELSGDNLLYLQVDDEKIDTQSNIWVHFLLPESALKENDDFFEPYFSSIREKLLKILPFADKVLKQVFPLKPVHETSDTLFPLNENDFEIFKSAAEKNGVPLQKKDRFIDLFEFHFKTPAPNFYISNPQIFSAFGLESKLILGLKITDLIWQEVEKVKKRAMKSERRIA